MIRFRAAATVFAMAVAITATGQGLAAPQTTKPGQGQNSSQSHGSNQVQGNGNPSPGQNNGNGQQGQTNGNQPAGVAFDPQTGVAFGTLYDGNDCSGALGKGAGCALNGAPLIAKFDIVNGEFVLSGGEKTPETGFGTSFQPSMFSGLGLKPDGLSGSFIYDPGPTGPLLTAFVLKAGNYWKAFDVSGATSPTFNWAIDWGRGLSHISFYGLAAPTITPPGGVGEPIPAPAALLLLGSGLVWLGLARHWRARPNA